MFVLTNKIKNMTLIEKLAPYLPYGITIRYEYEKGVEIEGKLIYLHLRDMNLMTYCKPILRPLIDIKLPEFHHILVDSGREVLLDFDDISEGILDKLPYSIILELIKNHFDVFGMIKSGEAINVNTI